MKTVFLYFMALLPFSLTTEAFEVDFSKDGAEQLFDTGSGRALSVENGTIGLPSRIETLSLPVEAGKKYLLQIHAGVDGSFVVEENDRAHIMTLQSHQHRLTSTFSVVFHNRDGEIVPSLGGEMPGGFFLTKESVPYTLAFYAPQNAAHLKVQFQSNGRVTRMSALRLIEEREEKTVNPNPDFRYGELSYSGWRPLRDGRLYTRPDGKTILNTGHLGMSPFFLLKAGRRYRFSARGEGANLNAHYFDKEGKRIVSRFLLRPAPNGAEVEVIPPRGTAIARVVTSGVVFLEEFKVVELN